MIEIVFLILFLLLFLMGLPMRYMIIFRGAV